MHNKTKTNTEPLQSMGSKLNNTNNRTTALERISAPVTGGLKYIYWYQIFALDYVVVKTQTCLARIAAS